MNVITVNTRSTRVSIAFRLVDAVTGGSPVSEVLVRLADVDQIATVTPAGYVLFLNLPDGEYDVIVEARDYFLSAPVTVDTAALDLLTGAVELSLEPRASYPFAVGTTLLYATVINQIGVPVADARVEVMGGEFDGTFSTTDASGRCVLYFDLSTASKNISLTITKASYQNKSVNATLLQKQTVSFTTQVIGVTGANVAVVSGTVTDSSASAVSQANIAISPWGLTGQTGPDGRFVFARSVSANENITLTISQTGFADAIVPVAAVKGGLVDIPVSLNLKLQADTACLEVKVVNSNQPLAGALVEVIEKNRAALTDSNGAARFYFDDLQDRDERVNVRASKSGYSVKTSRQKIRRGKFTRVSLRLRPDS